MRRAWFPILVLGLLGQWFPVGAAPAVTVIESAQLVSADAGRATLTLALSGTATTRLFQLDGPDRIVLDLSATQLAPGVRLPAGVGPVTVMRSGVQPGALRLVLETRGRLPAHSRVSGSATEGWRLVLELGAAGAPAAAAPVPVRSARTAGEGRDIIVAIDAGHGGKDPGAIGRSGTREKDVVLGIATALARRIDAEPGMRAVLTRSGDRFIPLHDRVIIARAGRADIFISVHADAIANRKISGSSVYVLSERGASSEAARWLAERENAADLKGGVSLAEQGQLASVLMDLSQTASIGSSMEAAERVLTYMDRVGQVRKSQVQQAPFVVLKSPDIPSMLVETAYISNPAEESRLRTSQHQQRIANAIFSGVREYFRASPPDGSLFAQQKSRGGAAPIMAASGP